MGISGGDELPDEITNCGGKLAMFLMIKPLLQAAEIVRLLELSRTIKFAHGRASNPANQTKDNLQADHADQGYAESVQIVARALARSPEFSEFAFPKKIAPPLLCRYEPGMKYGAHADAAYIQTVGGMLRSDLSCTVFLSDPATYEGGELAMHHGLEPIRAKGQPGEAIVYPSTMLHEVVPVRSGARIVSITFIESLVPDQFKREQLYALNEIAALEGLKMTWESRVRFEVARQNILRMWSTG